MSATEDWREYFDQREREKREQRRRERDAAPLRTAEPGWYPQPDGRLRYWEGAAWTTHFRRGDSLDQAPPQRVIPPMPQSSTPLPTTADLDMIQTAAAMLGLARARASRMMMWGLLLFLVGSVLTAVGLNEAMQGTGGGDGGGFVVFWGAIVFGGWRFFRGLYFYSNPEKLLR